MKAASTPRRPTLADLLLASEPRASTINTAWVERSRDNLRVAKKFVLDAQAAAYAGAMIRDNPRIIADAQDFAIPPFERMWIELPFQSFWLAVTGRAPDATGDRAVGYLFHGPSVKVVSLGWAAPLRRFEAQFVPVEYQLHRPMSVTEQLRLAEQTGTSRVGLDLWFWGESASKFLGGADHISDADLLRFEVAEAVASTAEPDTQSEWDRASLRALRDNHSVTLPPMRANAPQHYKAIIDGSAGDLRNIVALLLFLNRTADIQYRRDVPMMQTLINRRPKPMMPHTVIALKLDPAPRLRMLCAGAGIRRRLHDVRGHYCHDRRARLGCPHGQQGLGDWGEWWQEYEPLRWRCSGCGGRRWWKPSHHRGDAKIGVIRDQQYAVTK